MPAPTAPSAQAEKAALKNEFQDWNIVLSDKGRWWAFRTPASRKALQAPQLVTDLNCDTAAELRAQLRKATS